MKNGKGVTHLGKCKHPNPENEIEERFPSNILVSDNSLGVDLSSVFSLDNWFIERIKKLPVEIQKMFPHLVVSKPTIDERVFGVDGDWHPTMKPIELMAYLVELGSMPNELVIDPFMGSGTTPIACIMMNREYIGIDITKEYFDKTEHRIAEWKKLINTYGCTNPNDCIRKAGYANNISKAYAGMDSLFGDK